MTEQRDADSPSTDSQQLSQLTDEATTKSVDNSWTNRIGGVWNNATTRLTQLLPVEQLAQTVIEWFSVSEAQVAEILEKVRAELPTTEALLIGKPQAGKSSIVRGLTGVSSEIIGQGFRPHTQHTQRYAYPSNDLPLLIFTDTVGLGDVNQDTQGIIQELVGDLQQETRSARILLLTVKINDFATDTLRQIAQKLRQKYPDIPCLLAVTCLHEVYPLDTVDHPVYPPEFEEVNRAFTAIQEAFAGLSDRSVLIDFTLEEDGYNPVFYGLEALRDSLAELLPQAEAQAIYQLLDQEEVGKQIGNLYRDTARRYICDYVCNPRRCAIAIYDNAGANCAASFNGGCSRKIIWADVDAISGGGSCECDRWWFSCPGDRPRVN
jgi:predicted GTPase